MSLCVLKKPWQFRQVYKNGKKIDCKYAVLFYYRAGELAKEPQFGFVASRRLGGAVKRNRAKRLLRETAGRASGHLKHRDLWIVLVARSGITNVRSQKLLADIYPKLEDEGLVTRQTSS